MKIFLSRQFFLFLVTGGVAAGVNFASRIVYDHWLDFSTSIILAYVTGMATAYVLAKLFVFRESRQNVPRSVFFFTVVNLVAVVQTWAISLTFAYYVLPSLGVERFVPEVAHAVGVAFPVFTSFVGHKYWSFR